MIFILICLGALLLLWFEYDRKKCAGFPPGPMRLPLLGSLVKLVSLRAKLPYEAFEKLADIYGDIIYVRTGMSNAVVFNSNDTIREILSHEYATDRDQKIVPLVWERMFHKNLGIMFSNGREWQSLRRFTLRTLRDFGFGKTASMDQAIQEELEKFLNYLKLEDNSMGVEGGGGALFQLTVINILWRLLTGRKYELNDERMKRLLQLSNRVIKSGNCGMDLAIAYPPLYNFFPNWMGKTVMMQDMAELGEFVKETIEDHRLKGDYKYSSNSYVDEFLLKIDSNAGDPNTEFTDEQLVFSLLDLFQAGSDTTSNTLSFSMLYMIIHQDTQAKVQKEIDGNVDKNEWISLDCRERLPFTYATLLECTRYACVVPFSPARQASQDFYFRGYLIKKGMSLIPNLHGLNFNKEVWGDPDNFRPDRFLGMDGKVDTKVVEMFLPFGHGSRKCLGSRLAEDSLFLYFSTLLRNFKIEKGVENEKLSIEPVLGFTQMPKPFQVRFVPRR